MDPYKPADRYCVDIIENQGIRDSSLRSVLYSKRNRKDRNIAVIQNIAIFSMFFRYLSAVHGTAYDFHVSSL
jgi:hypothetical protein